MGQVNSENIKKCNSSHDFLKAASDGDLKIIRSCLNEKYDVNISNNDGKTPLMLAIEKHHMKAVKFLLEKGANIHIMDRKGDTALQYNIRHYGDLEINKMLFNKGAYVNMSDHNGNTLLHISSDRCDTKLIEQLLDQGANTDIENDFGYKPLELPTLCYAAQKKLAKRETNKKLKKEMSKWGIFGL